MLLNVKTKCTNYDIILEDGSTNNIQKYANLKRKCLIITDENIPTNLIEKIKSQCLYPFVYISISGEGAKSLKVYEKIMAYLLENHFARKDLIIALGGGVIGDLSGFVAATYMRGIDFINIPTTTLSQIDSSIGGKVAINLHQTKNIIGAFYPPILVIIDTLTLNTLPLRHYNNGIVEALKAGLIYNANLFNLISDSDIHKFINEIIYEALLIKKEIVEIDEFELGLRKILNFGHTLGHGFESYYELKDLLHGESVALGMWRMIEDDSIKAQLLPVYEKLGLKTHIEYDQDKVFDYIKNDKKADQKMIEIIKLKSIGTAYIQKIAINDLKKYLED